MALAGLTNSHNRFSIKLRFATHKPDGLLFYNGRLGDDNRDEEAKEGPFDFASLRLEADTLVLAYSLGERRATEHRLDRDDINSNQKLSNGRWRTITLVFAERAWLLALGDDDACEPLLQQSAAGSPESPMMAPSGCRAKRVQHSGCTNPMQPECYRSFDLDGPLYLGYAPPYAATFAAQHRHSTYFCNLHSKITILFNFVFFYLKKIAWTKYKEVFLSFITIMLLHIPVYFVLQ